MIELDRREGPLGTIRILQRRNDGARLYCLGASVQTMIGPEGTSLFGYVHAIKLLLRNANDVLVVGGAGGSLATMLARRGHDVTVIDIDPAAEHLARRYFSLAASVRWINDDASAFIGRCSRQFDAVVVDACDADGLTSEFAAPQKVLETMAVLDRTGSLILNLVGPEGAPEWGWSLACAIAAKGLNVTLFRPEDGWEGNELLHVSALGAPHPIDLTDIQRRPAEVRTYLFSLRAYSPRSEAAAG